MGKGALFHFLMEQQQQLQTPPKFVALVVGVTGMAGLSLAEALKSPTALGGPWKVYGAARRPKPAWFPPSLLDGYIQLDAADGSDTHLNLSPIANQVTHLFWVALHVQPTEDLNIVVNSAMLTNVLAALSPNLRHVTLQTGTKHYMGPIFDPDHPSRGFPLDLPFLEDSPRLPYPNFYYALEDLVASYSPNLTWSVHRSSLIFGASSRSFYNFIFTVAAYAEICRVEGSPFRFPGTAYTWEHFCDASDVGVLAEQQIWAATTERAKNQAFNCTNGDVFSWKKFWKVMAEAMEVELVEYGEVGGEGFDWAAEMKGKGGVWDAIVRENGLYETKLEEVTCFEAVAMVLNFEFQHVSSMNKSREYGFMGYVDTLKSVPKWVQRLREMNIIPTRPRKFCGW